MVSMLDEIDIDIRQLKSRLKRPVIREWQKFMVMRRRQIHAFPHEVVDNRRRKVWTGRDFGMSPHSDDLNPRI